MNLSGPVDFRPKLISSLRDYSSKRFKADLVAGIVTGIVALPLAIAFGIASGVSPTTGLITAIIGGFLVSALGGCTVQIGGPTGAFIVIVYGIIAEYGLEGLAIATVMAGLILVMLGLFHLGTVIKFIPYPIVVGFTAGIALTIFSTQINDFLGLGLSDVPSEFLPKWGVYLSHLQQTDWVTLGVGIASLLIIIATPRISKKLPGALISIIVMTVAVYFINGIDGISIVPLNDGTSDPSAHRPLYWNFPNHWGVEGPGINFNTAIRLDDHKLIYNYVTGEKELYDVGHDITESHNLADERKDLTDELSRRLGTYLRSVDAQRPTLRSTGKPLPWPDER